MVEISGNRIGGTRLGAAASPDERRQACETFGGADGVKRARSFAAEGVAQWGGERDPDVLVLVVSELVTNAVTHGGGWCELRLICGDAYVRVEVTDRMSVSPVVREFDAEHEHGRGMIVVDALASEWGVDVSAAAKVVWAQVPC